MNRKDRRKKGTEKYNLIKDIEKIDYLTVRRFPKEFTEDDIRFCNEAERYLENRGGEIETAVKIGETGELIVFGTVGD